MGISYILDIVIGLFFIYLLLSLLASEIQELITTILQWRAVHVKQSIEGLLSGNEDKELATAKELTGKIYDNPLIKDLNHSAKGLLAKIPRLIGDSIGKRFEGVFGKGRSSGPSSINKQVFASSFLETLQIPIITKYWTIIRLESFIKNKLADKYKETEDSDKLEKLNKRKQNSEEFNKRKQNILIQYNNDKISFADALDSIATEAYRIDIELFQIIFEDNHKDNVASEGLSDYRKKSLMREVTPSFQEVFEIILCYKDNRVPKIYVEIYENVQKEHKTVTYEKIKNVVMASDFKSKYLIEYSDKHPDISSYIAKSILIYAIVKSSEDIKKLFESIPDIPKNLKLSLYHLAKQSQAKVQDIAAQTNYFQSEVEDWFDLSMARASGVYKRNAKLVAFIIGVIIAIAANADTFHVVDRLAKDQALRESVNRTVDAIVTREKGELTSDVQQKIKKESEKLALPIGWGKDQVNNQQSKAVEFLGLDWRRIAGWVISGIAISMGASFWFDLLGKFIDIKNVGKKTPD